MSHHFGYCRLPREVATTLKHPPKAFTLNGEKRCRGAAPA